MSQFRVAGGRRRASGGTSPLAKVAHWWDLESNGTAAVGTSLTSVTGAPTYPASKVGNGFYNGSATARIFIASAAAVSAQGSNYSVNVWAKLESFNVADLGYWILEHRTTATSNFQLFFRSEASGGPSGGALRIQVGTSGANAQIDYSNLAALDDSAWRMYTLVIDKDGADQVELFVNGSSVGTASLSGLTPTNSSQKIAIGGANWSANSYSGRTGVDSSAIFNAVLTQDEIDYLYNSGSGVAYADL